MPSASAWAVEIEAICSEVSDLIWVVLRAPSIAVVNPASCLVVIATMALVLKRESCVLERARRLAVEKAIICSLRSALISSVVRAVACDVFREDSCALVSPLVAEILRAAIWPERRALNWMVDSPEIWAEFSALICALVRTTT